ncbi:hypothetical protein Cni_G09138 [Canna indica]|uniref:Uncharacterized protein n=1 Tax=Canna indica TaxID=4628 RepID=A0AAQ3K3S1_9LILI|nr:hypothetical protein Cni_G09138 [Canna indica]
MWERWSETLRNAARDHKHEHGGAEKWFAFEILPTIILEDNLFCNGLARVAAVAGRAASIVYVSFETTTSFPDEQLAEWRRGSRSADRGSSGH